MRERRLRLPVRSLQFRVQPLLCLARRPKRLLLDPEDLGALPLLDLACDPSRRIPCRLQRPRDLSGRIPSRSDGNRRNVHDHRLGAGWLYAVKDPEHVAL
jgi:hypothetical protein